MLPPANDLEWSISCCKLLEYCEFLMKDYHNSQEKSIELCSMKTVFFKSGDDWRCGAARFLGDEIPFLVEEEEEALVLFVQGRLPGGFGFDDFLYAHHLGSGCA